MLHFSARSAYFSTLSLDILIQIFGQITPHDVLSLRKVRGLMYMAENTILINTFSAVKLSTLSAITDMFGFNFSAVPAPFTRFFLPHSLSTK
jgi:hypothetical protein